LTLTGLAAPADTPGGGKAAWTGPAPDMTLPDAITVATMVTKIVPEVRQHVSLSLR
jgi:hypothetical protein